jgi:hypothetical protein
MRFSSTGSVALAPLCIGIALIGLTSGCLGENSPPVENGNVTVETLSNDQLLLDNMARGVRLTVPGSWAPATSLRPDAELYAANVDEDLYVMVLADPQDSAVSEFSLTDNASLYRRILARQLDRYTDQRPTTVTSINGLPAIQYEIRGEVEGTPVVYLHTTVQGQQNYYQVIGWTRADQYASRKATLQQVIGSFRGV